MRVFTVASESRYVVVRNVPALGVIEDLLKRLSLYGKVCEYRLLDHADDRQAALRFEQAEDEDNEFTDTVWVQYETVNNARHAKARGVQSPLRQPTADILRAAVRVARGYSRQAGKETAAAAASSSAQLPSWREESSNDDEQEASRMESAPTAPASCC